MKPYDLHIAYVSWGSDGKHRPVVILFTENEVAVVFQITTRYDGKSESIRSKYLKIIDWQKAGLAKPSFIDTGKAIDIPVKMIVKLPIGRLSDRDRKALTDTL